MQERMGTQELIVTRGGQGALWVNSLGTLQSKIYPVTVKDTVGAGDSFLAAMLFTTYWAATNSRLRRSPWRYGRQ